ncbi:MAG: hypothetical protein ACLFN1_09830 [Bacteroidales bacterium]
MNALKIRKIINYTQSHCGCTFFNSGFRFPDSVSLVIPVQHNVTRVPQAHGSYLPLIKAQEQQPIHNQGKPPSTAQGLWHPESAAHTTPGKATVDGSGLVAPGISGPYNTMESHRQRLRGCGTRSQRPIHSADE